jgi:hypothetical protein
VSVTSLPLSTSPKLFLISSALLLLSLASLSQAILDISANKMDSESIEMLNTHLTVLSSLSFPFTPLFSLLFPLAPVFVSLFRNLIAI